MQHCGITKRVYIFDDYITSLRNGIGVYVKELSYCLNAMGCTVTFIMLNSNYKNFTLKRVKGMDYLYFPIFPDRSLAMQTNSKVISRFLRLYIEDSIDNVFFFNHSPADTLMGVVKEYYVNSKFIYVAHNLAWSTSLLGSVCRMEQIIGQKRKNGENRGVYENWKMQLQTMKRADAVVCLSEDTLNSLSKLSSLSLSKIHLIPNGLRLVRRNFPVATKRELREIFGISPNEIILLFVGRMTEAKGILALLKALSILREYKNIRLAVAGSVASLDLNNFTEVMPNVIYLGHLEKGKLYQWYKMADIGVVASYTEQCSYVGLEMMLYGLPIVASDGFGVQCMFENEINAVTACIGNRESDYEYVNNLVNAIIKLTENDELKMRLVLNGQKILRQRYSIKIMKENYKRLLISL